MVQCWCSLSAIAQAPVPRSSHVVLLIEENTSYSTTVADMPWLVKQGSANGHAANYFSDTSGSLMDYLWLDSGSCHSTNCVLPAGSHNFGCNGNDCASPITDNNIFREMNNLGISWKVYAQSYAAAGGKVTTPDLANGTHYYRRHNGATWYSDILSNSAGSQAKIVDFSQFATDLANNTLPQFSMIIPDGLNDGHDASASLADGFLSKNLPSLLAKPYFQPGGDGLLIITFDNGDGDAAGRVYTAVIGPNVAPKTVSNTAYKHENTLRTLLDTLGIATDPGASANVSAMTDFFSGHVTITSPVQNATTGTQVLVSASATESNAQIYQLQVWDNTTGKKLAESSPGSSTISQTVTLAPGSHQIIVEDISTGTFNALHKASVNITVSTTGSPDGVTITAPTPNSRSGTQVLVSASARESSAQVYQLQVWDNTTGQKLAESSPGSSTISQTVTLAPGAHEIIVEDISTGTFQAIHKSSVTVDVSSSAGVSILSPVNNSTLQSPVLVSAFANSSAAIDRLEVWDTATGTKLADSFGAQVDAAYALPPGQHTILVQAISTGNSQIVAKSQVGITVN
jgi:hypothetical protein